MRNFSFQTSDPNLSWEKLARHKCQGFVIDVSLMLKGAVVLCHSEKCCQCDSHTSKWERVIGSNSQLRNDIQENNRENLCKEREQWLLHQSVLMPLLLFASHSTNWPRNIWSSKGTRPLLLTVRSTLAATSLACSWTPLVLWNIQRLGLEEKALSPLRRLLSPPERAPSKARRAQVDATGGNVLPYQDMAQGVKWERWLYDFRFTENSCSVCSAFPVVVLVYQLIAG